MNIVDVLLARDPALPPIAALGYEYVVAGNGLFVRAEDSRMEACIPVAAATLHGLAEVQPYARLKVDRVGPALLWSIQRSARRRLPNEAMYQLAYDGRQGASAAVPTLRLRSGPTWRCWMPGQVADAVRLTFEDDGQAVVDLHSHGSLPAFFSETDDADEQGLRFYAVIGRLDTERPEIRVRAGVYGQHWDVPAAAVFEGGPFVDRYGPEDAGVENT
jgi:PRTRC genetic system protein A